VSVAPPNHPVIAPAGSMFPGSISQQNRDTASGKPNVVIFPSGVRTKARGTEQVGSLVSPTTAPAGLMPMGIDSARQETTPGVLIGVKVPSAPSRKPTKQRPWLLQ